MTQITNHQPRGIDAAARKLFGDSAEALREFLSAWNQEEFAFLPLEKSARRAADLLDRYDAAVKP